MVLEYVACRGKHQLCDSRESCGASQLKGSEKIFENVFSRGKIHKSTLTAFTAARILYIFSLRAAVD